MEKHPLAFRQFSTHGVAIRRCRHSSTTSQNINGELLSGTASAGSKTSKRIQRKRKERQCRVSVRQAMRSVKM